MNEDALQLDLAVSDQELRKSLKSSSLSSSSSSSSSPSDKRVISTSLSKGLHKHTMEDIEKESERLEYDYNKHWLEYEMFNVNEAFKSQLNRVDSDWNQHERVLEQEFLAKKESLSPSSASPSRQHSPSAQQVCRRHLTTYLIHIVYDGIYPCNSRYSLRVGPPVATPGEAEDLDPHRSCADSDPLPELRYPRRG